MRFVKMHGIGNDYIFVNGFTEKLKDPVKLAQKWSSRNFGIGADGLVLILPSKVADLRMQMFNADGSEGQTCGNALRCIAKLAVQEGLLKSKKDNISIETASGIVKAQIHKRNSDIYAVTIDMGYPRSVDQDKIITGQDFSILKRILEIENTFFEGYHFSIGNPHFVIFSGSTAGEFNIQDLDLPKIGPKIEHHSLFAPARVNTEFVQVLDPEHIRMRVWERGSGETLACGSGACAAAVAAMAVKGCQRKITVSLLGGELQIYWRETDSHILKTGPAVEVFRGEIPLFE